VPTRRSSDLVPNDGIPALERHVLNDRPILRNAGEYGESENDVENHRSNERQPRPVVLHVPAEVVILIRTDLVRGRQLDLIGIGIAAHGSKVGKGREREVAARNVKARSGATASGPGPRLS